MKGQRESNKAQFSARRQLRDLPSPLRVREAACVGWRVEDDTAMDVSPRRTSVAGRRCRRRRSSPFSLSPSSGKRQGFSAPKFVPAATKRWQYLSIRAGSSAKNRTCEASSLLVEMRRDEDALPKPVLSTTTPTACRCSQQQQQQLLHHHALRRTAPPTSLCSSKIRKS